MTETDDILFQELLKCIKILKSRSVAFPEPGSQNKYQLMRKSDESVQFSMIINRKGHLNKNNLTYQMISHTLKNVLVRLDCSGAPHNDVPTPHIHIFDREHDFGRKAIGLQDIEADLANELLESLYYFLDYNNVDYTGVSLPLI